MDKQWIIYVSLLQLIEYFTKLGKPHWGIYLVYLFGCVVCSI